jgi:hypothetical protein
MTRWKFFPTSRKLIGRLLPGVRLDRKYLQEERNSCERLFGREELMYTCHVLDHTIHLKGVLGDTLLVLVQQVGESVQKAPYHHAKEVLLLFRCSRVCFCGHKQYSFSGRWMTETCCRPLCNPTHHLQHFHPIPLYSCVTPVTTRIFLTLVRGHTDIC